MTDIRIFRLTFGGAAFEPLTDAGRAWCSDVLARNPDYSVFKAGDGCMAGFSDPAFGCEPYDFQAFAEDINDAGLTAAWA